MKAYLKLNNRKASQTKPQEFTHDPNFHWHKAKSKEICMTKVQNCLFANGATLATIEDASFVKRGENVVVLGLRRDTRDFASKLHAACMEAGLKVSVATGGSEVRSGISDSDPEIASDLLLIVDRRAKDLGGKLKGAYHDNLLTRRTASGRSSIILSETLPLEWDFDRFLGDSAFKTAARLGMGLILDVQRPDRRAFFDRVNFSQNPEDLAFFNANKVAPVDWIRDPSLWADLGICGRAPVWHWLDLYQAR